MLVLTSSILKLNRFFHSDEVDDVFELLDTLEHHETIQARLKNEEFHLRFFAGTSRGDHTIAT